ncbi:MAG TPA: pilus assembly protein CpaE [Anaeromyxobacteraceae bacterium]|nr:pilus assembly protein CpaE [Anaeromyxobacteraceae bacterium]
MDKYPIQVAATPPELETALATAIGQAQAIRSFTDWRSALASLAKARPGVAVVGLPQADGAEALELVRELSGRGTPVVAHSARKDPDVILSAMRAGAREFFVTGEEQQVARAVQGLLESSGELRLATVTAVLPAKGGLGATVLATHLAGALARRGQRVCLGDLDLELGDVLTFLDMAGSYSLADVAANARRLDRELLDASVPRHGSGVWVLSQSEKVHDADRLGVDGTTQVLRFLRHHYDHLVLDGLRDFGDITLAALDLADRILLVVTQEVPSVRNAQRCAGLLQQLGYGGKRITVVVNRYAKGSNITVPVIEETLKLPVQATVGNDFQGLSRAINRGVLLWDEAPRSVVARDVDALAEALTAEPGEAEAPSGSLLSRLFAPKAVLHGAR